MHTETVEPLAVGTRVTFPYYTHNLVGIVTRDSGKGIVWVRPTVDGEPSGRERWMHRESLTVTE